MDDKLRIPLTPAESEECLGTVAITFMLWKGRVIVGEEWEDVDESFSNGVNINIPLRVWNEGLAWLARTGAVPPSEPDDTLNDIAAENEFATEDWFNSPSDGDDV